MTNQNSHRLVDKYRGFEIMANYHYAGFTEYYYIAQDKEPVSTIALATPKAAKNVIDTHIRALSETKIKNERKAFA